MKNNSFRLEKNTNRKASSFLFPQKCMLSRTLFLFDNNWEWTFSLLIKTQTFLFIVHYELSFASIQSLAPTSLQLCDPHSSFKNQPNCNNKLIPSRKPTQKVHFHWIINFKHHKLANKQNTPKHKNKQQTSDFGAFRIHDEQLSCILVYFAIMN